MAYGLYKRQNGEAVWIAEIYSTNIPLLDRVLEISYFPVILEQDKNERICTVTDALKRVESHKTNPQYARVREILHLLLGAFRASGEDDLFVI